MFGKLKRVAVDFDAVLLLDSPRRETTRDGIRRRYAARSSLKPADLEPGQGLPSVFPWAADT